MYYNVNNMARVGNAVMRPSNFLLKDLVLDYKLMDNRVQLTVVRGQDRTAP